MMTLKTYQDHSMVFKGRVCHYAQITRHRSQRKFTAIHFMVAQEQQDVTFAPYPVMNEIPLPLCAKGLLWLVGVMNMFIQPVDVVSVTDLLNFQ